MVAERDDSLYSRMFTTACVIRHACMEIGKLPSTGFSIYARELGTCVDTLVYQHTCYSLSLALGETDVGDESASALLVRGKGDHQLQRCVHWLT